MSLALIELNVLTSLNNTKINTNTTSSNPSSNIVVVTITTDNNVFRSSTIKITAIFDNVEVDDDFPFIPTVQNGIFRAETHQKSIPSIIESLEKCGWAIVSSCTSPPTCRSVYFAKFFAESAIKTLHESSTSSASTRLPPEIYKPPPPKPRPLRRKSSLSLGSNNTPSSAEIYVAVSTSKSSVSEVTWNEEKVMEPEAGADENPGLEGVSKEDREKAFFNKQKAATNQKKNDLAAMLKRMSPEERAKLEKEETLKNEHSEKQANHMKRLGAGFKKRQTLDGGSGGGGGRGRGGGGGRMAKRQTMGI